MRFDRPISGQAAYAARQYSIKLSEDDTFWPTFLRDDTASISSEYATIKTDCIFFSGDATIVWAADYINGTAPGVTDSTGCSVSGPLAWKLWGSVDLVGKTVMINEEEYLVRGVFEGNDDLALISVGDENISHSWHTVELVEGSDNATRVDAENYSIASGLGKPDAVLDGTPAFIAGLMAAFPLIVMAGYAIGLLYHRLLKNHYIARNVILFILFIGFAAILPTLLDALPDWLIPGRWSDFSFWSSTAVQFGDTFKEVFSVSPGARDMEGRKSLFVQACIMFAATLCAVAVCFRWQRFYSDAINRERL